MDRKHFIYGGIAGSISRSCVAPFDKIKILMQYKKNNLSFKQQLSNDLKYGVKHLWKGNLINTMRIFPYSGIQFFTYDTCKKYINPNTNSFKNKLLYGSISGLTATSLTHPIDVIRHRLMCYSDIKNIKEASKDIYKEKKSIINFYRGYNSTVISLTPYIALNLSVFDYFKNHTYLQKYNTNYYFIFNIGVCSSLISQTICYPLDTIRRRMHNKDNTDKKINILIKEIIKKEGIKSFYKGIIPNIIKMIPNNGIRFTIYNMLIDCY